jgi:hypothetical protein
LRARAEHQHLLVLTRDNPDVIASGWMVAGTVREETSLSVRFTANGANFLAENRQTVDPLSGRILTSAVFGWSVS